MKPGPDKTFGRTRALALMALLWAAPASGATITSTYTGPTPGDWNVPGNWTPNAVPTNGADLYNANIPSPSAVTVNGSFTIQSLDVDAGASALVTLGQILTLNAYSVIDGALTLGSVGSSGPARLRLGADLTLAGAGTVDLHRTAGIDSPTGARLTTGPNLTVRYNGQAGFNQAFFDLAITNNGNLLFEGSQAFINHPDGQFINSSTGTVRASNTVRVDISATNNPITIVNEGLWEADGGVFVLSFAEMTNTGTLRVRNNGSLRIGNNLDNTGGVLIMETGGRFIPTAVSGNMNFTGGAIIGGVIDQADPNAQGTLTLQGGIGADAMDISGTRIAGPASGPGLALAGDFDFANNVQIERSVQVNGSVNITGSGNMLFALNGGTGDDTLTLGSDITLTTPSTGSGFSNVKTVNTAGLTEIRGDFILGAGGTFTSTGPVHVFENANLSTADGASVVLRNTTAQLDTGAAIIGGISLDNATVNGAGTLRGTLNVAGTNTVNVSITAPTTIVANGAALLDGSGGILNDGASGQTILTAAVVGATFTTGADFGVILTNHGLTVNVPWLLQGNASFTGGALVAAANVEIDGEINLAGNALMQVNAGANVVAGSTGMIRVGPDAKLEVTGPSTLGGSYSVSGDFVFTGGGAVPVVGDWDGDATSEITVNAGAIAQFSRLVSRVGDLTVNNGGAASFELGITNIDGATVRGLFSTTGDTSVASALSILGGTHGGAGTTTAPDVVMNGTINGGRTVVALNTANLTQANLMDGTLVNKGAANLGFNVNTITGNANGTLQNEGALTQSGSFNRINTNVVQTSTGATTVTGVIEFNGNSTIDGSVTVSEGATLALGATATDTTHTVNGQITGGGTLKVAGNTTTGAAPTVALSGPVDLTGPNSGTEVRDGATLQLTGEPTVRMGEYIFIDTNSELIVFGILGAGEVGGLFIALFNLGDQARSSGAAPAPGGPLPRVTAERLTINANDTPGVRIENLRVAVTESATLDGTTTLAGSVLQVGQGATANFRDGARLSLDSTQALAASLLDVSGTLNAQGFPNPENPSPPVVIEAPLTVRAGGAVVVQPGATLELSGGGGIAAEISGTVTIERNSLVRLSDGADLVNKPGGILAGGGTLDVSLANSTFGNEGEVAPGSSAGILTIIGNAPFSGTAKLSIEIGGTTAGTQYDRLAITSGAASLDGTLSISLINSFTPAASDSFTILTATAGVTGFFENAATQVSFSGGTFDVFYNPDSVVLSNFAIPEPGSAILATLGGALLLIRKRGRDR